MGPCLTRERVGAVYFLVGGEKVEWIGWANSKRFVRSMLAGDAKYNPLQFSTQELSGRVHEISDLFDTTNPDLSAFLARGGKLILKGNGADYQRSVLQEITYYKSVVAKMGRARADQFIRFYVTPGVNHPGNGVMSSGAAVPAKVGLLGSLARWGESGKAPGALVSVTPQTKASLHGSASRSMCPHSSFSR